MTDLPIFSFENCSVHYPQGHALFKLSLCGKSGETVGIVGESGSGKTTLAKTLLSLQKASSGSVFFKGEDIKKFTKNQLFSFRKQVQIIFQDPDASMNPRKTALWHLEEVLHLHFPSYSSIEKKQEISKILEKVHLDTSLLSRYSYELSGGQKQRLAIARALLVKPALLILDEPLSSLDAHLRSSILSLLIDLQKVFTLSYLFITHDLSTVGNIASTIAVLYRGCLVELLPSTSLKNPIHPYTKNLISSIPIPDPQLERKKEHPILKARTPPLPVETSCPFAHKCPHASSICLTKVPEKEQVSPEHFVYCHHCKNFFSSSKVDRYV